MLCSRLQEEWYGKIGKLMAYPYRWNALNWHRLTNLVFCVQSGKINRQVLVLYNLLLRETRKNQTVIIDNQPMVPLIPTIDGDKLSLEPPTTKAPKAPKEPKAPKVPKATKEDVLVPKDLKDLEDAANAN